MSPAIWGVLNEYVSYTTLGHSHIQIRLNQNLLALITRMVLSSKIQGLNYGVPLLGLTLYQYSKLFTLTLFPCSPDGFVQMGLQLAYFQVCIRLNLFVRDACHCGAAQHLTLRNFKILRPSVRENTIGLCVKFLENISLFIRLIFASNETTPLMTMLKRFLGVSHLIVHFLVVV